MIRNALRPLAFAAGGLLVLGAANCAGEGHGDARDAFFDYSTLTPEQAAEMEELYSSDIRLDDAARNHDADGDFRARTENVISNGLVEGAGGGAGGTFRARDEPASTAGLAVPVPAATDQTFPETFSGLLARRKALGKSRSRAERIATWKRAQSEPNSSSLFVGDTEKLPLEGVQASVRIDGFRARVVLDCFYRNDREGQLEGTFKLRLPDGATPYFFAFGETRVEAKTAADVQALFVPPAAGDLHTPASIMEIREPRWSEPREARMVPREKAAHAYGEIVRRRIDPALMEWAGAGVFSSRVFPLMPGKLHRIVIGYDVDLIAAGADLEHRVDLPADAGRLDVTIDADASAFVDPAAEPRTAGDRRVFHFSNPDARTITVRVPGGATMLVGDDPETGSYMAASVRPELPEVASAGSPTAVFLVDVSLSSNPERFGTWLKMLRAILERNRDSITNFAVVYFNVETFAWRDGLTANTPKNVDDVIAFSDRLTLEGATDLGAALGAVGRPGFLGGAPHDLFLLSDGAPTWGEDDLQAISDRLAGGATRALFAYRTGFAGTDARTLGHLARESGGAVFSVVGEDEVAAAAAAHRARPWHLENVTVAGASDLLIAGRPTAVFPGQRLKLVGRGAPAAGADVVLRLRQDGRPHEAHVAVARIESDLAPRAYGEVAVTQIEDLATRGGADDHARAYATHFRVVGKTCSLLMLETEQDYEQYGIVPQEDAYLVKSQPAEPVIAEQIARRRRERTDARAGTLAWLRGLATIPGGKYELPASLEVAIGKMPASSFTVATRPLGCDSRVWSGVPGRVQEQLVSRKLDYDTLVAEAGRRNEAHGGADALRVLSSLVEANPGDTALARDVGFSAMEWGLPDHAYHLFRRVARARPYEPQTYRAMARALDAMGKTDLAIVCYEVAVGGEWNGRHGAFRRIAAIDYFRMLRRIEAGRATTSVPDYAAARLRTVGDTVGIENPDLVVAITWNTDRTDVDLHVTDPNGEECYYQHRSTKIGGKLTDDVTGGYGPEMFVLPDAIPGEYTVEVVYFSADRNRASLRTKVQCTVIEGWGTPRERVTEKTVTLARSKEREEVVTVEVER